jgi:hypothetical protein
MKYSKFHQSTTETLNESVNLLMKIYYSEADEVRYTEDNGCLKQDENSYSEAEKEDWNDERLRWNCGTK